MPGYEHQAFIPYDHLFDGVTRDRAEYIQATVQQITAENVMFERPDGQRDALPYVHLVYAAGSRLPVPLIHLPAAKRNAVDWLKGYQDRIANATSVLVAGAGALGIRIFSLSSPFLRYSDYTSD